VGVRRTAGPGVATVAIRAAAADVSVAASEAGTTVSGDGTVGVPSCGLEVAHDGDGWFSRAGMLGEVWPAAWMPCCDAAGRPGWCGDGVIVG
jgi:hypothetical protein